ncbi:MAG: hypothetical protein HKN47_04815 [Pirellulaceae bacterium]|nr:hypothetical protein [Pirellulaceae bacterium]
MKRKETTLAKLQAGLTPRENAADQASGVDVVNLQAEELQRISGGRRMSFGATCPTCSGGCEDDCGYDPC